jgi:preprotein translocase YajC subunit
MNPTFQIVLIVAILVIMYMLMIRPQKKREKQINEMRSSLKAGDSVTTIGGIKGKILSVKDDSIVLQVGADKVKLEVMRWAISKVEVGDASKSSAAKKSEEKAEEAKPARKPRKLTTKAGAADSEEEAKPARKPRKSSTKDEDSGKTK